MIRPLHKGAIDFPLSGPRGVLMRSFDVPDSRRDITNLSNVRWLLRNLRVKNSTHKKIDETLDMLKKQFKALQN
jgi:hypothetical protein